MPESSDQHLIEVLYRNLKARPENGNGHHKKHASSVLSDEQVIGLCRKGKNAPKFAGLYDDGDLSEHGGDDSTADAALLAILAFYTQDPDQLDRLFRKSALYRPEKWGRRADYRERTIKFVLDNLTETYGTGDGATLKNLSSPDNPSRGSDDDYTSGEVPGLVCFAHRPGEARDHPPRDRLVGAVHGRGHGVRPRRHQSGSTTTT